jgi:murein DD-endopeptidase MepM/ murein hydrolase activator NlpD
MPKQRRTEVARRLVPFVVALALVAPAHLVGAQTYLVRQGDTLSEIAQRLGVPLAALAAANNIADPDFIVEGQLLVVPVDGGLGTEYVVADGDTLSGIADKLGVPMADLAAANGIADPNRIQAGRLLSVRGRAQPGSGRYTVREGDNLSDIAWRLGVGVSQLAASNGITDPNWIYPGQVLAVPGRWECPVPGATFVNDYGLLHRDGDSWWHAGVDLFAPRGTPVLAPEAGVVTHFPNPKGGLAVHLRTGDSTRYYFAHLEDYGESGRVAPGTVIGYVGTTGDARLTSPHLHFEMRPGGGDLVNPYPTLVAACR